VLSLRTPQPHLIPSTRASAARCEQGIPRRRLDAVAAKLSLSQRCQGELRGARGYAAQMALMLLAELEETTDAQEVGGGAA